MSCQNCNQTTLPTTIVSGPPGSPGADGTNGIFGGVCVHYQFSASTSGSDPGPGLISFDSSLLSTSQHLYINNADINAVSLVAFIASLDIPNNSIKALLRIVKENDASSYTLFEINDVTAASGFYDLDVTYLSGGVNPFAAGDDILFCPALSGDSNFDMQNLSPDYVTGINYPAATRGDVFRILTPGYIGTTTAQIPPNSIEVFKDDVLYCISTTAGGNQASAGASFFSFSYARAFYPEDTTNGTSNFILNNHLRNNTATGGTSNVIIGDRNSITGSSTNILLGSGNGVAGHTVGTINDSLILGQRHNVSNSNNNIVSGTTVSVAANSHNNIISGTGHIITTDSVENIVGGASNIIDTSVRNILGGTGNRTDNTGTSNFIIGNGNDLDDSDNNVVGGNANYITGKNNVVGGEQNPSQLTGGSPRLVGSDCLVVGFGNKVTGNLSTTPMSALVAGAGSEATIKNSLNLGATNSPSTYEFGGFQTILVPIAGVTSAITSPSTQPLTLTTDTGAGANSTLTISDDTIWYFEAELVVVQHAVGANYANSSTISDNVTYKCSGAVRRDDGAGGTSLIYAKWLDHRGNYIHATSPGSQGYRTIYTVDTSASVNDIDICYPEVLISGNNLIFRVFFPGRSTTMPDTGIATPIKGVVLGSADVNLTNDTLGSVTVATVGATTFRNPKVDVYGGFGLAGGNGMGATCTATLTATDIASIVVCSGGNYSGTPTVVITPALGGAAATAVMSGTAVSSITVTNPGAGYTTPPAITFSGGGEVTPAVASAVLTPATIASVAVTNAGIGYTSKPRVTIYEQGLLECGNGNGGEFYATGTVKISQVKF